MSARQRKTDADQIVRYFNVSEPTLHKKGHTVYKITQKIIHVNHPEKNVEELVVWRRYNDLRWLHSELSSLHHALHRRQHFPPFAQAKLFGRYEQAVLIERQRTGQDFLNFIAQRHYLVSSEAFHNFFKDCEAVLDNEPPALSDIEATKDLNSDVGESHVSEAEICDNVVDPPIAQSEATVSSLGGVWRHQAPDDICLPGDSSDDDEDDDVEVNVNDVSVDKSQADVSIFDPFGSPADPPDGAAYTNTWLLSALTDCQGGSSRTESDASLDTSLDTLDATLDSQRVDTPPDHKSPDYTTQYGRGDFVVNPMLPSSDTDRKRSGGDAPRAAGPLSTDDRPTDGSDSQKRLDPVEQMTFTDRVSAFLREAALSVPRRDNSGKRGGAAHDKADYIVQASQHFKTAQACEENSNFYMAFNFYKQGIGILLTGVQKDDDERRRHIVRKKTARYLKKAEALHSQDLLGEDSKQRWQPGQASPVRTTKLKTTLLCGNVSELKNLRVLGVIHNVQLVMDKLTERTYVIKVVHKRSGEQVSRASLMPSAIPFMVELHRYYETDSAVYLVLQHATGGRFWSYVSGYLAQAPQCHLLDALINDSHERQLRTFNRPASHLESRDATEDPPAPTTTDPTRNESLSSFSDCATSYCALFSTDDDPTAGGQLEVATRSPATCSNGDVNRCGRMSSTDSMNRRTSDGFELILQQADPSVEMFSINSSESDQGSEGIPDEAEDPVGRDRRASIGPPVTRESPISDEQIDPKAVANQIAASEPLTADQIPASEQVAANQIAASEQSAANQIGVNEQLTANQIAASEQSAANQITVSEQLAANQIAVSEQSAANQIGVNEQLTANQIAASEQSAANQIPASGEQSAVNQTVESDQFVKRSQALDDNENLSAGAGPSEAPDSVFTDDIPGPPRSSESTLASQAPRSPTEHSDTASGTAHQAAEHQGTARRRSQGGRLRTLSAVFGDLDLAASRSEVGAVRLPEVCVRRWVGELVVAVSRLHAVGVCCRDLRPDNILLGARGHILLSYFCELCEPREKPLNQYAIDQMYAAPELSGVYECGHTCDWWSVGSLMYELLTGKSLASCHPSGFTSHTHLHIPEHVSTEAEFLLRQLLKFEPSERLGGGEGGVDDIKSHPFFSGLDWSELDR